MSLINDCRKCPKTVLGHCQVAMNAHPAFECVPLTIKVSLQEIFSSKQCCEIQTTFKHRFPIFLALQKWKFLTLNGQLKTFNHQVTWSSVCWHFNWGCEVDLSRLLNGDWAHWPVSVICARSWGWDLSSCPDGQLNKWMPQATPDGFAVRMKSS